MDPLTFSELDGLAFAAQRGRFNPAGMGLIANDIGPVFELGLLAKSGLLPWPGISSWLVVDGIQPLVTALSNRRHLWVCPKTRTTGVYRTYATSRRDEPSWVEFGVATHFAAIQAGFARDVAAQLAGAIGEMQSNIYEHSQASRSGIVAFKATPGMFEFVVCDRGIGVLQSLRSCPDYAEVPDHGQALTLALSDGVSRFGAQIGRGLGFQPLFTGLANLDGTLRFRSGDYALTIDGRNPGVIPAKLWQKPTIAGFLISVACRC